MMPDTQTLKFVAVDGKAIGGGIIQIGLQAGKLAVIILDNAGHTRRTRTVRTGVIIIITGLKFSTSVN